MRNHTSRSLKIGFVYDDSLDSDDGVAQYVKRLGGWLENQGHEVSYLVGETKITSWGKGRVYSLAQNLTVRWGGNRLSIPIASRAKDITKALSAGNFDVLHVQFPFSPFMAQRVINRANGQTAVVGTIHVPSVSSLSNFGSKLLRLIYGRSLRRFNRFISVSKVAQDYAKKNFNLESEILPNTVDIKRFRSPKPKRAKNKKIVFLGRLTARKGCLYLIKAFSQLAAGREDLELIIAGDGPHRQRLEDYVRRLRLSDKVNFLGHVPEDQKPKLLSSADIAVFPSLYGESFGIVLIEAMAAGAGVVIGGNNPGYASVLGEQPKLLVNPKDTAEFASRLAHFLDNPSETSKAHSWQQLAVEQYDINIVGKKLAVIYESAIAKANKSRHN